MDDPPQDMADMLCTPWLPPYEQNGEYVPRPMLEPIMEETTDDDGDDDAEDMSSDAISDDEDDEEEEEESSASSVLTAPDTSSWYDGGADQTGGETGRSGSETGSVIRVDFTTGEKREQE